MILYLKGLLRCFDSSSSRGAPVATSTEADSTYLIADAALFEFIRHLHTLTDWLDWSVHTSVTDLRWMGSDGVVVVKTRIKAIVVFIMHSCTQDEKDRKTTYSTLNPCGLLVASTAPIIADYCF